MKKSWSKPLTGSDLSCPSNHVRPPKWPHITGQALLSLAEPSVLSSNGPLVRLRLSNSACSLQAPVVNQNAKHFLAGGVGLEFTAVFPVFTRRSALSHVIKENGIRWTNPEIEALSRSRSSRSITSPNQRPLCFPVPMFAIKVGREPNS